MHWIIPKRRDQKIAHRVAKNSDFNAPLTENEVGTCVAEEEPKAGQHEADDDIRQGRVKRFDNPNDLIDSLEQPW